MVNFMARQHSHVTRGQVNQGLSFNSLVKKLLSFI
jgi:hypothetical protein